MRPGSLRTRLVLIVLIATLPALVLALGAGFTHRRLLAEDARDDAAQAAESVQDHQIRLIADTRDLLISLSRNPVVMGSDRQACSDLLRDLVQGDRDQTFSNLAVAQLDGLFVCSGTPMTAPVNVADRVYFQRALATGEFATGEHVIGRVSGRGTLLTGLPVFGADGAPLAVLHAGIDLSWVSRMGTFSVLPEGSRIAVIDRKGLILAQYPDADGHVGQRLPEGRLATLIAEGALTDGEITDPDGTELLFALRPFDARDASNAIIYVSVPREEALAEANHTLWQDLLTVSAVGIIGLAAAWFGGEAFFLRRVQHLIAIAERLAGGDLAARTDREKDAGELGRLEQAFDDMAASLERRGAEREQISRELAVSEARYRSVVDQVQEVIFQTDAVGSWTFLNPAWYDITGFPVAEALDTPFLDYVHPDDRPLCIRRFGALMAREKDVCRHEVRYLTKGGGYRWVEVYARLVLGADGAVTGTTGTLMDVTERRRATSALLRQDRLLKGVAAASNHLLVTQDLRVATDDALRFIGEAAEVDRVRLFEVRLGANGAPVGSALRSEWLRADELAERSALSRAHRQAGGHLVEVPPLTIFPHWVEHLGNGRPLAAITRQLPHAERALLEAEGVRSILVVPIMIDGALAGSLGFDDCDAERSWSPSDVAVFETMAGAIGGAIVRRRDEDAVRAARQAAERETERLLALHRASTALASPTADLDQVVSDILKSAADLVGAEAASLYRWDADAGLLRCVHNLGVPGNDPTPDMPPGTGLAGRTFATGAPIIVNDYPNWPEAMTTGLAGGLQAGIGVPLRHAGRPIGVLLIRTYRVEHHTFAEHDVRLASLFADQAAAALENVRLHRILEHRVDRLRTMAHLAQLISSTLAMSDVPREIAAAAARLMDAPVATLWMVDEARGVVTAGAFSPPELQADFPGHEIPVGQSGVGWVAAHREPLKLDDIFADGRVHNRSWWQAQGLPSYYAVPVMYENRLVAVLALHGREPFRFDAEDRELLDIFVATIAVALWNASLFEALGETNRALADSVERANALAEQAQAADRAKSEFLSRVSHELRTPLNAILGFAQVLDMRALAGEDRESVHHIMKGGQHLLGLINEVLDISRIESGTLHLSLEAVEAREVVLEVYDLVRPLAEQREIRLATVSDEGFTPWVTADRQRFKQVLLNLVTNAVKYNHDGGSVTVTCEAQGEHQVRLAVCDTGRGIAQSKIDRLFDPFDRLGAESSGIEGTGLGLAISRALTEAMGGSLQAESTVGVGSIFTVELPVANAPAQAGEAHHGSMLLPDADVPAVRRTILYVEDNTPNRVLVEQVLAWRPGIELLAAPSGRAGLELAEAHRPDLVLLDLHLPDMHGRDVLGTLRGDPSNASLPIVVLSADANPAQIQSLLAAGADAFLTKPIAVRELLQTIDAMLERAA